MMTTVIRPAQFNDWRAGPGWFPVPIEAAAPDPTDREAPLLVGAYLEHWLTEIVRGSVRPKTYVS
ncbi:MAG: hypothetical protein ACYDCI_12810 [Candidatus Limnocylindrales bacterium]